MRNASLIIAVLAVFPGLGPVIAKDAGPPPTATPTTKAALWLLPAARPMPTDKLGPFIRLADRGILTVDKSSAFISHDEGISWSQPIAMFPAETPALLSEERSVLLTRGGTIVVTYADQATRSQQNWNSKVKDFVPEVRNDLWSVRSTDGGKTWRDVQLVQSGYGLTRDMIQAGNGNLVLMAQNMVRNPPRHVTTFYYSRDDAKTWQAASYVDKSGAAHVTIDIGGHGHHDGAIEPAVEILGDGRLWMLIRTGHDWFWQAFSDDHGVTWKDLGKSSIGASAAPATLKRLVSGRLLLLWNQLYPEGASSYERRGPDWHEVPASYHREELSAALSSDDGKAWTPPVVLARQRGAWLAYANVFERQPGELWITTMHGGLRILLNEKDLLAGEKPKPSR